MPGRRIRARRDSGTTARIRSAIARIRQHSPQDLAAGSATRVSILAKFIPPQPPADHNGSVGEQKVYKALANLDDHRTVFYPLRWIDNRKDGESDFVLLHPEFGIIVLEIKDGEIGYRDGNWIQTNTVTRKSKTIDPFGQAQAGQHFIMSFLKTKGCLRPVVGYAV